MAAAIRLSQQHSCSLDHLLDAGEQRRRNYSAQRGHATAAPPRSVVNRAVPIERGGNVAIYLSSSYCVQSSSRILSACGWYLLTVARGPMTIARHPYTGSGITFIAAALMPILGATISASSDAVFFSTASASRFFILGQPTSRYLRNLVGVTDDHQD